MWHLFLKLKLFYNHLHSFRQKLLLDKFCSLQAFLSPPNQTLPNAWTSYWNLSVHKRKKRTLTHIPQMMETRKGCYRCQIFSSYTWSFLLQKSQISAPLLIPCINRLCLINLCYTTNSLWAASSNAANS